MTEALDPRAIRYATQRVDAFNNVQRTAPFGAKIDAISTWLESLGLEETRRAELSAWLDGFLPDWNGEFIIGLVVGLLIAEYQRDFA